MGKERAASETGIGGARTSFDSTLWPIVLRAKDPACRDRGEALQKLIEIYWKPVYSFIRRKGHSIENSKDLTQGFFTELLAKDFLKYLDRDRGRFRTFLLTAITHYLADDYDRASAQKRGGGRSVVSLDTQELELDLSKGLSSDSNPDQAFRRDWAIHVLGMAMDRLEQRYTSAGESAQFDAFKMYITSLRPEGQSYEQVSKNLGISVDEVRDRIRKGRALYRDAILEVIRVSCDSEKDVQRELQDLLTAFS